VIPSALLKAVDAGAYKIKATVTSAFGDSTDASAQITVKAPGMTPLISIVGPTEGRSFKIKDGFKITSALASESVCDGKEVRWGARRRAVGGAGRSAGPRAARRLGACRRAGGPRRC
jgi:hypothetical protein